MVQNFIFFLLVGVFLLHGSSFHLYRNTITYDSAYIQLVYRTDIVGYFFAM